MITLHIFTRYHGAQTSYGILARMECSLYVLLLYNTPQNHHHSFARTKTIMAWDNLQNSSPRPIGGYTSLVDIAKKDRPRRTNGAIFRRQSNAPTDTSSQAEPAVQTPSAETQDVQPPVNPSYESSTDPRYTKDRILDIFKTQQNSDAPRRDVSNLYVGNWDPGHSNGTNGRGWGKSHDGRDNHGPTVCWDANGSVQPIGLEEMSEVERSVSFLITLRSFLI
jgi:PERQ amino acid-rich with GYF domain-containing protein